MTQRLVLEEFHYAADGVNPVRLPAGTDAEIGDEHVTRFEREKKIETAAARRKRLKAPE